MFGWTTYGHAGDYVPLWAYGPKYTAPTGLIDNTYIAKIIADALNFSLNRNSKKLYVNVADEFAPSEWTLDMTDPANPFLQIMKNGKTATLPVSADLMTKKYRSPMVYQIFV